MSNAPTATTVRPDGGLSNSAQSLGAATVAEIREALAGLAGNSDMALLMRVGRWLLAQGWGPMPYGGCWQSPDYLASIDWEPHTQQIRVQRRPNLHAWWKGDWHPVSSVREAIDLLVLLGVLPAEFSSLYAAGRADRALGVAA